MKQNVNIVSLFSGRTATLWLEFRNLTRTPGDRELGYQRGQYTIKFYMLVKFVEGGTSCPLMGLMKSRDPLSG